MPSINHDGPIEVIRKHPDMTADLVRLRTPFRIPSQGRIRVELGASDASNVVPDEFRADMVTVIRDRVTGSPLLVVVVESQGRKDREKRFSWPAYLANLRAAHECDSAILIVVCWDAAEADKCREAIPMGHPGYVLVPIVIDPDDCEILSGQGPWLTVFAASIGAIDLMTGTGQDMVLAAIADTGTDDAVRRTLEAIILAVAPEAARSTMEAKMETVWKNDFADRHEAIGVARGEARFLLKAIRSRSRKITLTPEQEEQISSCLDSGQLDRWYDNALVAFTADEVFKD